MVPEIYAGIGAIKTAFDMAKGLKDIDDAARRNAAVIELQEKILSAQSAQAALVEAVSVLEKEVADLKAWGSDKQRYDLVKVEGSDIFAYAVKEAARNGEPNHYLCATCYQNGKKSVLQPQTRFPGRVQVLVCHQCGSDFYVSGAWEPAHGKR